jgi:hypothetical protein
MTGLNPFKKVWFWILILSIIGFIVALATFESMGQTTTGNSTPIWIWVIFGLSILFWIVALVLYSIDVAATKRRAEIAEACGELPPPPPKKKIECPKKQCVEKKVISCSTPCNSTNYPSDHHHPDRPLNQPTDRSVDRSVEYPDERSLDRYSSVKLKPLSALAPSPAVNNM